MAVCSRDEGVDVLLICGGCGRGAHAAERLYNEGCPRRRHPNRRYFGIIEQQLGSRGGSQGPEEDGEDHFVVSEETEISVLAFAEAHPTISVGELASEIGISRESVGRILKKHNGKSCTFPLHQHLCEGDAEGGLGCCLWFRDSLHVSNGILFADESHFTNSGMFGRRNVHCWATISRREVRVGDCREGFGTMFGARNSGSKDLGAHIFSRTFNGRALFEYARDRDGRSNR